MSTKQTEALKLALEALEHMCMHTRAKVGYRNKLIGEAMDKAREALAEQPAQQEPRGWQWLDTGVFRKKLPETAEPEAWRALYTSPQPSKPWVGLDDTDLAVCDTDGVLVARYWERVLREKNA